MRSVEEEQFEPDAARETSHIIMTGEELRALLAVPGADNMSNKDALAALRAVQNTRNSHPVKACLGGNPKPMRDTIRAQNAARARQVFDQVLHHGKASLSPRQRRRGRYRDILNGKKPL